MRKFIIAAVALLAAANAGAATIYRDRFIPSGVCMIEFAGKNINAHLIKEIDIGPRQWFKKGDSWFSSWEEQPPYTSLRVTLVNREYYEVRDGDLYQAQRNLLKTIRDNCRN